MPLQPKELTAKELTVAREEAQPTLRNVLLLLLRGGAPCYLEFERRLLRLCEVAHITTRFAGADGRTYFQKKHYLRANPEDVKMALRECGVLLGAEDYRRVRVAYGDAVGFVRVDPFLSALCPTSQLPAETARALVAALPASEPDEGTEDDGCLSLPDLSLRSVTAGLAALFAEEAEDSGVFHEDGAGTPVPPAAGGEASAFSADAREAARCAFTEALYPSGRVPGLSVVNFIAATLLLLPRPSDPASDANVAAATSAVVRRLPELAGRLTVAPIPVSVKSGRGVSGAAAARLAKSRQEFIAATSVNPDKRSSMADFSMTHENVPRQQPGFPYYAQLEDRRDEWLRGRQEKEAQSAYMRHTVGYAGHLPEMQFHFGRTFHVIEEALPQLTKPKPALAPITADAFGPGHVLKGTPMTQHHFTLA